MSVKTDSAASTVPLFSGLSRKQVQRVLKEFEGRSVPAGETIITKGELPGRFYLVTKGTVSVTDGNRELGTLGPGEFFGEMSIVDNRPRSATVRAVTPARLLSISSWNFLSLIEENFSIAEQIMAQLSKRVRSQAC